MEQPVSFAFQSSGIEPDSRFVEFTVHCQAALRVHRASM
jgi:hypothetical protein